MNLRYMLIVSSLIGLFLIVIGGYLLLAGSVIWSYKESGDPSGEPNFVVFNPLREKAPEKEAAKLLNLFKSGNCQKAIQYLKPNDYYTELCGNESSHTLKDWKLSNRYDADGQIKLYYRVKRTSSGTEYNGEMWISIEKTNNGWKLRDIDAIY